MPRDPADVPLLLVNEPGQLSILDRALRSSEAVAIDTEVPIGGPRAGQLRVMSIATRSTDGDEQVFVVDGRDLDPQLLRPLLSGVTAVAWNANFDARVIDAAVWDSTDTTSDLTWWDAQLADALLHQGRSGFTWYHGLAWATEHYLGLTADGKGSVQLSYDATSDLTPEQIAYAGADAIETLWVGDVIRRRITEAGLGEICDIEMEARPFLDQMERTGLPFDRIGWEEELVAIEAAKRRVVGELAGLTGGGQGTLFDDVVEPNWNPASDRDVRAALNRWAEPFVRRWTAERFGSGRLLDETDSVTASVLREIGGPLSEALLEYRKNAKLLSTYGDSILEHLEADGRLRPQYLQVVGTNTGRLASRNPNAQNFSPRMKPHFRPPTQDRVFVHADLSQAELRYLAQVADDEPLRAAFARGDDVHVSTAASMFGVDPERLADDDPARLKHLRQIAKALNFGIAYGTGPAALARSLTAEGSPTTVDEAKTLLAQYRATYPGTAAWAEARIAEIQEIRARTTSIDWPLSLRLARGFSDVASIRRSLRKSQLRWPSATEIADHHPERLSVDSRADLVAEIEWLLGYSAPVALTENGEPFTFSSRTLAGRRQQFNLHLDRLFLAAVVEAAGDRSPTLQRVRRGFEADHGMDLSQNGEPRADDELGRSFEDRALRRDYLRRIEAELGAPTLHAFLGRAAKARVSLMVNAWRNAPIQGGVADIMLAAYADLHRRLAAHPSARPVQTVHDSVVIECGRDDAAAVQREVRAALEGAVERFCPDVTPRADVDVRTSLAEDDVLADAEVI